MATVDEIHAALRRMAIAHAEVDQATARYKAHPSDWHANDLVYAWKEARAAVDAIVALELPPREFVGLAT